jgi:hypothetical protein
MFRRSRPKKNGRRGSRSSAGASRFRKPSFEILETRQLLSAAQIVAENQLAGSSGWALSGKPSTNIEGYAAQFSVDHGQTVDFKINTKSQDYRIDIYRTGWYQGQGGRLVATLQPTNYVIQPAPVIHFDTNAVDASNWHISASWTVPTSAVSGVYIAKLTREDGTFGENQIFFVVRDDEGHSDLLFQTSDTTWQAYNTWGGSSLYYPNYPNGRSYAVSYSRPFNNQADSPLNFYFGEEFAMVRFLERNGYDVSYAAGIDTARAGSELLEHKVFMSVGHDEYWSGEQRDNVEAARDAGINLAFFSGNEVFWKTRWGADNSGQPYTMMIDYKETLAGAKIDPLPDVWTGTWRDPRFAATTDGGQPENALTGTIFTVNSGGDLGTTIDVSSNFAALRFWRNTVVANLAPGQQISLGDRTLGYEWDEDLDNGFRPAGLIPLSSTTRNVAEYIQDYGTNYGKGTATHSMTMYRAGSGALVFGAGTIQYSWALDTYHAVYNAATDPAIQQATVNLFADMGVQPAMLMSGLIRASQSTDNLAPISTILSPVPLTSLPANSQYTIRGTAQERGGGVVAVVEVSVDGGVSWHRATGTTNWTYTFTTRGSGSFTVMSRAVDDSGNLETNGPSVNVNPIVNAGIYSLWTDSDVPGKIDSGDNKAIEVGLRFTSDTNGVITGIRFYKSAANTGTHVANLWTASGQLIASATFTNETASGWQQVNFATPVHITAGVTYIASYFAPKGRYSANTGYFSTQGISYGALHANPAGPSGANGIYAYGSTSRFPNLTSQDTNYWVDVVLNTIPNNDHTAPTVESFTAEDGSSNLTTDSAIVITLSEAADPITVNSTTVKLLNPDPNSIPGGCCGTPGGWCSGCPLAMGANTKVVPATVNYNPLNHTITVTPSGPLATSQIYTVLVVGGPNGVTDLAGNSLATDTGASFLTPAQPASIQSTIWPSTIVPTTADSDTKAIEIGTKFTADANGVLTGLRFYKTSGNTGTHVANLWTSNGQLLATAMFTDETASGWQQVNFATPVAITAGVTYVASYHTNVGRYAATNSYFTAPMDSGMLNVPANGGVYAYGAGGFPMNTYLSTNYWVDVVLKTAPLIDNTAPTVLAVTPSTSAQNVGTSSAVNVKFSEAIDASTITTGTLRLVDSANNLVSGALSYDANSNTATLTPDAPLAFNMTYTIVVVGGPFGIKDLAGNPLTQTVGSSFVTVSPPAPDFTPPSVVSTSPPNGSSNILPTSTFSVTFSEDLNAASVDVNSILLLRNATNHVTASLSYNAATRTVTITPSSPLEIATNYTIYVPGGANGVRDLAGNVIASDFTSTFMTAAQTITSTMFASNAKPKKADGKDKSPIEVGVTFTADSDGYISGIRFYKSAANTGMHIANLWTSTGQLIASATYANETLSGWQQVNFAAPVAIKAGTTYVASYFAPNGHYSTSTKYFKKAFTSGKLHAPIGGGVYQYGDSSEFPTQSYKNTNYWVDVVLNTFPPADTTPPIVASISPASGATNVSINSSISVKFSEAMNSATISNSTVKLMDGSSIINANVAYNSSTNTATVTPIVALENPKTYTISVVGGFQGVKDAAGNPLAQDLTSNFTTGASAPVNNPPAAVASTLFASTAKPATSDSKDSAAVELGVTFVADTDGYITGIRFYKNSANKGTHIANLWTSTGQLIASATFTSESSSGWQQVNFATPVAITAGTTYVASYFAPQGHYSVDRNYFSTPLTSGHLQVDAGGGVFAYAGSSVFPNQSYQNSNYWVDVLFAPAS